MVQARSWAVDMLIRSSVKTLCDTGFVPVFTNAHLSTLYRDTGTCMCVSPPTRTVSGKVHPLSIILQSLSDVTSWIIWLVASPSPRRSRSVPGYSGRHLLWTRWHRGRFFPLYFSFPLSFSINQCPILICNRSTTNAV